MAPAVLYMGLDPTSPGLQEAAKKSGMNLPPAEQFLAKLNGEVDRVSQAGYTCDGLWVMDAGEDGVRETIEKLKYVVQLYSVATTDDIAGQRTTRRSA